MSFGGKKKPLSSCSRDSVGPPEDRVKRVRLTRSTSRVLPTASTSSSQTSHPQCHSQSQASISSSSTTTDNCLQATPRPSKLPGLLDLSDISTHEDIQYRFGQIARSLMHEHLLVVSTQSLRAEYELLEVEFYLRKEGHEDPFAHGTPEQTEAGKWYFHRAPRKSIDPTKSATSLTGYRGGTRKGVDLTFGGPVSSQASKYFGHERQSDGSDTRGGILFRSMRRIADGTVISGPSLLVDELLRVCGCKNIADLVEDALENDKFALSSNASASSKRASISIYPRSSLQGRKPIVYSSPRIGLDLSHPGTTPKPNDPRVVFVQKSYRFFMNPILLTANGRSQTFLGIYNLLSEAEILGEKGVLDEVARLTGIKRDSVKKYAADLQLGKESGKVENFIGSAGKGASSSPSSYLKMMGTLATLCAS